RHRRGVARESGPDAVHDSGGLPLHRSPSLALGSRAREGPRSGAQGGDDSMIRLDRRRTVVAALTAMSVAVGCAVGPRYIRPELPASPAAFKEAAPPSPEGAEWRPAEPEEVALGGTWWTLYKDPRLDELMARIDVSNQSLIKARAQYEQAIALARSARAGYFPQLDAS